MLYAKNFNFFMEVILNFQLIESYQDTFVKFYILAL